MMMVYKPTDNYSLLLINFCYSNKNSEKKPINKCSDLFPVTMFLKMCNIPIDHTLVCPITFAGRCIFAMFLCFKGFKEVLKSGHIQIGGNTAVKSTKISALKRQWYGFCCACAKQRGLSEKKCLCKEA